MDSEKLAFPLTRVPAVWVLSLTLPLGYGVLRDTVEWTLPAWVMVSAYVPVYATIAWSCARSFGPRAASGHKKEPF